MQKLVFKTFRRPVRQSLVREISARDVVLLGLLAAVIFSALAVVYTKHLNRKLFAQVQFEQHQQDALHIEWSQLLLEQGAFASNARIERLARETLKMQVPEPKDMKVLMP